MEGLRAIKKVCVRIVELRSVNYLSLNNYLKMNIHVLIMLFTTAVFAVGCSSFDRAWEKALEVDFKGVEGRWIGSWYSDYNQHNGPLRCLITKRDDGDDVYHTRFHAKYKLWFLTINYPYDMDMTIKQYKGMFDFHGEADLGWLAGGVYKYDGNGTVDNIKMNYRANIDFGTFKLERPQDNK